MRKGGIIHLLGITIIALTLSLILLTGKFTPNNYQRQITLLEVEVISLKRELDSRFNVMSWDLEDKLNRRSKSHMEDISTIYLRLETLGKEVEAIKERINKIREETELSEK